jgi:hypothetical protein
MAQAPHTRKCIGCRSPESIYVSHRKLRQLLGAGGQQGRSDIFGEDDVG